MGRCTRYFVDGRKLLMDLLSVSKHGKTPFRRLLAEAEV
jgi:hypothetical protein